MSFNTEITDAVAEILAELGKNAVIDVPGTSTYTPSTGINVESGNTLVTVKISPPFKTENITQDGVRTITQTQVYMQSKDITFTPTVGMKITFDSDDWRIVDIESIYGGETISAYRLTIQR